MVCDGVQVGRVSKETKELLRVALGRGLRIASGKQHIKVFDRTTLVCVLPRGKNTSRRNRKMAELAIKKAGADE